MIVGWGVSCACDVGNEGMQGGVGGDHVCVEGVYMYLMGCVQVLPIVYCVLV